MRDTNKADHFGIVVKSARQTKGLTQAHLAELLAITPRYLKAIENSGRKPSYDLLARIIEALDIPADALFYSEQQKIESPAKLIPLWKIS